MASGVISCLPMLGAAFKAPASFNIRCLSKRRAETTKGPQSPPNRREESCGLLLRTPFWNGHKKKDHHLSHNQNPANKWFTQNHASRIQKADMPQLLVGIVSLNLHLPDSVLRAWLIWGVSRFLESPLSFQSQLGIGDAPDSVETSPGRNRQTTEPILRTWQFLGLPPWPF